MLTYNPHRENTERDMIALHQIKHHITGSVLFELECDSIRLCVEVAVGKRANLSGAYLRGADLSGAYLRGAYLSGANLRDGLKLVGQRPVLLVGPIGREARYVTAYTTDQGLRFQAGCFFGDAAALRASSLSVHRAGSVHAREYEALIALAEAHASLWPGEPAKAEAA